MAVAAPVSFVVLLPLCCDSGDSSHDFDCWLGTGAASSVVQILPK